MERFCFLRDTNDFLGVVCKYFFSFFFLGTLNVSTSKSESQMSSYIWGPRSKCGHLIIDFLLALMTFKEKGLLTMWRLDRGAEAVGLGQERLKEV